jgi:beta-lactamase class A
MRIIRALCWLLVLIAAPAAAATSPALQTFEQQLASIIDSRPGNYGVAALDLKTGEMISVRGDEPFPMASTVKIAVAANYLAQVEHGRRTLDDQIRGRSARALIDAMLIHSDNYATDILIRDLGGPKTLQAWLDQQGIRGLRIDRTIAQLLASPRDLWDVRDSSTPRAMVDLLSRLDSGKLLQPESRSYLLDVMSRCQTGKNRMRALLPSWARVEHKTGTLNGYTSDVGYVTLHDGRRLAIAIFARGGTDRPATIAWAARAIYDSFNRLIAPYRSQAAAFSSP